MRVIAGSARGRRLACLRGERIRPTQDRVREAVFGSLTPWLLDSVVLDLFAGTGAWGIEALSRGAAAVAFLDRERDACDLIEKNLAACGWPLTAGVRVLRREALAWLASPAAVGEGPWTLIFADPPYRENIGERILRLVGQGRLLADNGLLVLEGRKTESLPRRQGTLILYKEKLYGDTKISYYRGDSDDRVDRGGEN